METGQQSWIGPNAIKLVGLDKKPGQEHALTQCHSMGVNFAKEVRLCWPLAMNFIVRVSILWEKTKGWKVKVSYKLEVGVR